MGKYILIIMMFLTSLVRAQYLFSGGDGTSGNPYLISTAEDLDSIRSNLTAYYKLTNDIDLDGITWTPISNFNGTIDGDGFKIQNLTLVIDQTAGGNFGFLGLTSSVTLTDIVFEAPNFNISINAGNDTKIGIVIAYMNTGTTAVLSNIFVTEPTLIIKRFGHGDFSFGGIVGKMNDNSTLNMTLCGISDGDFTFTFGSGANYRGFGGLVGTVRSSTLNLIKCYFDNMTVSITSVSTIKNGNIAGMIAEGGGTAILTDCCVNVAYTVNATNSGGIGGLFSGFGDMNILATRCFVVYSLEGTLTSGVDKATYFPGASSATGVDNHADSEFMDTYGISHLPDEDVGFAHNTTAEATDTATYDNWNFATTWLMNENLNDGYPSIMRGLTLISPLGGEVYVGEDESVSIQWQDIEERTYDVYYSLSDDDWVLIAEGATSPQTWDFPNVYSTTARIKIESETAIVTSGNFTVIGGKFVNILFPDSLSQVLVGTEIEVEIQTYLMDSIRLEWGSDTTSSWNLITRLQTDAEVLDTVSYSWTLPDNITSPFYLRAVEDGDTAIYVFDEPLTKVGVTMLHYIPICWKVYEDYPVRSYMEIDYGCGWTPYDHTGTITSLSDMGDDLSVTTFPCDRDCDTEQALNMAQTFVTVDGVDKTINEFYTHGTSITYKGRQYFISLGDSSIKFNDLVNDIDSIFYADLAPYVHHRNISGRWDWEASVLQLYNVQQSKVIGQEFPSDTDFEALNDAGFQPIILIGGKNRAHGGLLVYSMDAQAQLPPSVNPEDDVVELGTGVGAVRDYFRGIHPKITK